MKTQSITVTNKIGLHARPISLLMNAAKDYQCKITISKGTQTAGANSIIDLLKLQVKSGDRVVICADGPDEAPAVDALISLIENKFGEE